jgi:hypothetical protein
LKIVAGVGVVGVAACLLSALIAVRVKRRGKKLDAMQAEVAARKAEQERFAEEVLEVTKPEIPEAKELQVDFEVTKPVVAGTESSVDFVDHVGTEVDTLEQAATVEEGATVEVGETVNRAVTVEEAQVVTVEEAHTQ